MTANVSTIRQKFIEDFHRPSYHFLPPSNWMNDPNGLIQWNGVYHLFYQHNPYGPLWGNMSWGHAVSRDLIHWEDLPLAMIPTPDSADEAGCFSGCAVNNDGVPTIFYTATRGNHNEIQTQAIATSHDDLMTLQKHPNNPIIDTVPPELGQTSDFRDPYVWREDDAWYMVLGSRVKNDHGIVLLYRSENLMDWEYLNPLLEGTDKKHGVIWECPNFFKLGDKWVLIISAHTGFMVDTVFYFVGRYENYRFIPEYSDVLDYGNLYASLTFKDEQGQTILFNWIRESRSEVDQRLAGWSGVQAIPRLLSLNEKNQLIMKPVPALEAIRGKHHSLDAMMLDGSTILDVSGHALDIEARFALDKNGHCAIALACAEDDREMVTIQYNRRQQVLSVSKVYPEANGALTTHVREVPHQLATDEPLALRILLDGSVIEILANDRTSLVSRHYPIHPDSTGVKLMGAHTSLKSLDIWEMPSIW